MWLADDESAAGQARYYARRWASMHGLTDPRAADLEVIVAELVSNAIRHGAPPYQINLHHRDGAVRGEVDDASPTPPQLNPQPDDRGGFGLRIVEAYTARWGAAPHDNGKRVWFEFPLRDPPR